jgi:hypothetical protein
VKLTCCYACFHVLDRSSFVVIDAMPRRCNESDYLEYLQVCRAFQSGGLDEEMTWDLPYLTTPEDLQSPLSLLSLSDLSQFELEDMFEQGIHFSNLSREQPAYESADTDFAQLNGAPVRVSMTALISGSNILRQHLIKLKTDAIYCALMQSHLATVLLSSSIRYLAQGAKEIEISKVGTCVYSSRERKTCTWFFLVSGKLKVCEDNWPLEDGDPAHYELNPGEIFGGYGAGSESLTADVTHVKIETAQASKYVELSDVRLHEFVRRSPDDGARLLSMMAGY